MANNLNKKYFTNTYITGSGRQNYLRIDYLEDPLFTSFTFDIDFISSPLFYTINYSDYGYPNVENVSENIEISIKDVYDNVISLDDEYEILPQLSASILDGNKLGFGIQQNVYLDMPLYGAAEYIYMVDKRNGSEDQNDVRFDSNRFVESGGYPNTLNSYKLGDSIKTIVNDSDKLWAERQKEQNKNQIFACDEILNDESVKQEHEQNRIDMENAAAECNSYKVNFGDKVYTEAELRNAMEYSKNFIDSLDLLKKEIATWVNGILTGYKNQINKVYNDNKCIQKIVQYIEESGENSYKDKIKKDFADYETQVSNFKKTIEQIITKAETEYINYKNGGSFSNNKVFNKFKDKFIYFGVTEDKIVISLTQNESLPNWVDIINELIWNGKSVIYDLMSYKCETNDGLIDLSSEKIDELEGIYEEYKQELDGLMISLYGDDNGKPRDMYNPSPDSPYGIYLAAKDKYENDDFSQASKTKSIASSGVKEMNIMIKTDERTQETMDAEYNDSITKNAQPLSMNKSKSIVAAQTVLDMLGFISGMKKLVLDYPYIIQGITGLDTAYKNHYGIKDPYLGSGDDKITLTCLESLDLRVSSMFNRYFNAIYDRQYRRERVPVNLRRFNCTVYVHDVRNFVSRNDRSTYNGILELTDMYYSVIEFRFYDCEIVPEETGNIFDNISNEAPSDMKKTNFTFTYGNCVVNFIPQSEVAAHNARN